VKFGKLTRYTPSDNNSRIFRTRRGVARGGSREARGNLIAVVT
jgi:sugar lactone lactonase YvrE